MITRSYFISGQKFAGDGSGSFAFSYLHFTAKSWLPNKSEIFEYAHKALVKDLEDRPGTSVVVVSFNRT